MTYMISESASRKPRAGTEMHEASSAVRSSGFPKRFFEVIEFISRDAESSSSG